MIKDILIGEIDKLKKQDFSEIDYLSGRKAYLQAISDIFEILATFEVKEVKEEPVSIWHDASEKSNEPEEVVIINPSDNTGEVLTRCTEVYQGRIWAYTSELLNLDNSCKIGKNLQEESVSEELEQEIDKYVNIPDNQGLPDLRRELSDYARHFANWQKEQDKETIELVEDHAMLAGMEKMKEQMMTKAIDGKVLANGMGNPILHLWDKSRHLIDKKVKVIVIKED